MAGHPANQALKVDRNLVTFLENWEAYVGYLYDDKVAPRKVKGRGLVYAEYKGGPVRGTITIGYGHTKAARARVDMSLGARMTKSEAERVLAQDLAPCEEVVKRLVKVPLTQGQFDALVSFVFNLGEGGFARSSLLAKLNSGNYVGARASFGLYVKSKGEVMTGLKRRRAGEQALWDMDAEAVDRTDPTLTEESKSHVVPKADEVVSDKGVVDTMKTTEGAGSMIQAGGGGTGLADQVDKGLSHADKALQVKQTAEQFGVEPISVFGKLGPTLDFLIHSPAFWFFLVVTVTGVYMFFRRRWRLRQEL